MIALGDSDYGKKRDLLKLQTTEAEDRACVYLEGRGYHFCVHFGTQNAVGMAKALKCLAEVVNS